MSKGSEHKFSGEPVSCLRRLYSLNFDSCTFCILPGIFFLLLLAPILFHLNVPILHTALLYPFGSVLLLRATIVINICFEKQLWFFFFFPPTIVQPSLQASCLHQHFSNKWVTWWALCVSVTFICMDLQKNKIHPDTVNKSEGTKRFWAPQMQFVTQLLILWWPSNNKREKARKCHYWWEFNQ